MKIDVANETDPARLQQIIALQSFEIERLYKRLREIGAGDNEKLQLELASLSEQIARHQREMFGRSSERRVRQVPDGRAAQRPKPRTGHGPSKQPLLPVVEQTCELEGCDRNCPECGLKMDEMVGQSETSEEIEVVQRSFHVVRRVRKKYRCRCGNHIATALGAPKLIPGVATQLGSQPWWRRTSISITCRWPARRKRCGAKGSR